MPGRVRSALLAGAGGLTALVIGLPLTVVSLGGQPAGGVTPAGAVGGACTVTLTTGPVALDAEQMTNARLIVAVAHARTLPAHAAVVALTTALQESSLHNLNHGDLAGPTSRGLFQQQPRYYPGIDIIDPAASAAAFYDRLIQVAGWQDMPAWQAAQAVQHSADPTHYARWQPLATVLAVALNGHPGDEIRCSPGDPAAGPAGPAAARISTVLTAARSQLGQPYVWGGGDANGPTSGVDRTTPPGFDCSGLMIYAWARAGISLPHSSRLQYQTGPHIRLDQARAGDMIFLATDTTNPVTIHHIALVIGQRQIIEAQTFGVPVHIRTFAGNAEPEIMPYVVRLIP